MKSKELTPKQLISVVCPTCGAGIGEPCELHSGALRSEPHWDRKISAADVVEAKSRMRNARDAPPASMDGGSQGN